jgi:light-independent protochlorophyllide reductase subunit B
MLGLEEHLLSMFRGDFEFKDRADPCHPVASSQPAGRAAGHAQPAERIDAVRTVNWDPAAERELGKIPFFVRGKARRNTERFAAERGVVTITLETLYDAKAHYGR